MRFCTVSLVVSLVAGSTSVHANNDSSGFDLKPGERIVAIDGVPVNGAATRSADAAVRQVAATKGSATQAASKGESSKRTSRGSIRAVAANIVGTLVRSGLPFSHTPGETALEKANYERRKNGVGNLIPDPQLQALALKKARVAASRGQKNHIGGSLGGARAEGVGHTQGRFLSCCLDMHATYGGAAMVQGADGWYCCLLVR